jgi:hypothetical protein
MADEKEVKAEPTVKGRGSFGGKIIKWSMVKDRKIGEIFDNKDCGMGEMIKIIWAFIKKNELNK